MSGQKQSAALARAQAIADQLRDVEARLAETSSTEVQLSLLERATEAAEEAARLLEQVARELE